MSSQSLIALFLAIAFVVNATAFKVRADDTEDFAFDTSIVSSVDLLDIHEAVQGSVLDAAVIGGQLYVAGTRRNRKDSHFWMISADAANQLRWFLLLDKQQSTVGHLASCGFFPVRKPFSTGDASPLVGYISRRGAESKFNYVTAQGRLENQADLGGIEGVGGSAFDHDKGIWLFGSGELLQDAPENSWVARIDDRGTLLWKTPLLFESPPSQAKKHTGEKPSEIFGGDRICGSTNADNGGRIFIGEHRYYTSKFGTGPSDLFLTQVDPDGRIINLQLMKNRRHCGGSRQTILVHDDSVFAISTPQGFADVLDQTVSGYQIELTKFDRSLDPRWTKPVLKTGVLSMGQATMTLSGRPTAPLLIASSVRLDKKNTVRIQWYDGDGELKESADIRLSSGGHARLVTAIPGESETIVICEFTPPRPKGAMFSQRLQKVMVIRIPSRM